MILRLPPEMDLQFYFSNVPSDSNWNRLVLIKNEISARNQWNPRRTDGELFEPSETWWIKTLQFLLEKSLPNCRSENERNILLCSSQASEIAECWSTHHLEWFHFWKFIQGMIFGPIVSERSTPYEAQTKRKSQILSFSLFYLHEILHNYNIQTQLEKPE